MGEIKLIDLLAISTTVPWVFLNSTEIESYEPLISYEDYIDLLEQYNNKYEYIDLFEKYNKYLEYTVDHTELDIEYYMGCELPSLRIYLKEKI
ncbi:hypothetical protein GJ20_gp27 [Lactococcus phage P092]|uniref:Uncharacterized protein n=1 Tax=Lactococcus phage P092 TaxID=1476887 RepID=X4YUI2_9CAUD|nr:hypothetical protein GJ20_gp27 [Lactococcus phage P092]AHV83068.1 hypothetical protein P092_0027 [Lactococcus phage P092]